MMSDVAARKGTLVDPVDRLSRISRILAITTGAAMLVVTLAVVGAWLVPMLTGVTLVPRLGRFARFFDDPLARTTAFAVIVGLLGVFLYALEQARRLFGEFAAGEILTSRAAMRLQRISYAVIAGSIAKPAAQFLLQVAVESSRGNRGNGCVCVLPLAPSIPLRDVLSDLAFLLAGLLLLAIAWALAEAARIAADHRQII